MHCSRAWLPAFEVAASSGAQVSEFHDCRSAYAKSLTVAVGVVGAGVDQIPQNR